VSKFISNLFLGAMAIGLTIFTATRTLDLLSQWLPVNQQIMQWLGLIAFEGGFYFWAFYFSAAAKGDAQRGIALVMTVICFIGISVATIMDLVLVGASDGKLPPIPMNLKFTIVVFVGVIIVLNVAAFMAAKLFDVDRLKIAAEQSAEDMIHAAGLQAIHKIGPQIATAAAPQIAEEWAQQTWQKILPGAARPTQFIETQYASSLPALRQQQVQQQANGGGIFSKIGGLFGGAKSNAPVSLPQTGMVVQPVPNAPKFISSTAQPATSRPRPHHRKHRVSASAQTPVVGSGVTQPKNAPSSANARTARRGASTRTK